MAITCVFCNENLSMPFTCTYCKGKFCESNRLAEKQGSCPACKQNVDVSKIDDL